MNDQTLWDVFAAEAARDEALARVDTHADPDWKQTALDVVHDLARTRDEITTDDVWRVIEQRGVGTHEHRALGAVMKRAAAEGWIARTDRTRRSERVQRHAGDVRVWRSLCNF